MYNIFKLYNELQLNLLNDKHKQVQTDIFISRSTTIYLEYGQNKPSHLTYEKLFKS